MNLGNNMNLIYNSVRRSSSLFGIHLSNNNLTDKLKHSFNKLIQFKSSINPKLTKTLTLQSLVHIESQNNFSTQQDHKVNNKVQIDM
jgi:hypothetical protein